MPYLNLEELAGKIDEMEDLNEYSTPYPDEAAIAGTRNLVIVALETFGRGRRLLWYTGTPASGTYTGTHPWFQDVHGTFEPRIT